MNDSGFDFPHCGRLGCDCSHAGPCVAGWIESRLVAGHVAPCPTCRGHRLPTEQERRDPRRTGRRQWLARLRETNAKAARNAASQEW